MVLNADIFSTFIGLICWQSGYKCLMDVEHWGWSVSVFIIVQLSSQTCSAKLPDCHDVQMSHWTPCNAEL